MKELKQLLSIIDPNYLKLIKGEQKKLVTGILKGQFETKAQVIETFYNNSKHSQSYYSKLYSGTKNTLIKLLIISNTDSKLSEIERKYEECYKSYATIKILTFRYFRDSAVELAKKNINSLM